MKKKLVLFITIFSALMPLSVHGDCGNLGCVDVKIENIYVTANSNVLVMTSGDETSLGCTETTGKYLVLDTDDKNSNLIYSSILAARTAEREIKFVIKSGSSNCSISRVEY